ncbi:conserved hypothetical protein [Candidatus Zixiibacteriota bacterium]|nr:conserved hypothetical protein [candidate division Zixibacteria bacterium]
MREFFRLSLELVALAALIMFISGSALAYTGTLQIPGEGVKQIIILEDGSTLVGKITEIRADQIKFQTDLGEMTIAVSKIKSIKEETEKKEVKAPVETKETKEIKKTEPPEESAAELEKPTPKWYPNANRTRLLIGPTARTLKAGKGYFYDLWIFFPGLAFGITDNFMISGGGSVIPDADNQMYYIMPKYRISTGKNLDLAINLTIFRLWDKTFYFGLSDVTYGTDDQSVTGALGFAFTNDKIADKPAAMFGGEYRMGRRASLVGECWFIPGDADSGVLGIGGLRLMGEFMTIDVGGAFSLDNKSDNEDETDWLPYIDFVWNF